LKHEPPRRNPQKKGQGEEVICLKKREHIPWDLTIIVATRNGASGILKSSGRLIVIPSAFVITTE